jgi:hypothetical protein|tara:strand:- start:4618 stop:5013 length:396 start_codon:yes stop_codon:yes gene_type:complete
VEARSFLAYGHKAMQKGSNHVCETHRFGVRCCHKGKLRGDDVCLCGIDPGKNTGSDQRVEDSVDCWTRQPEGPGQFANKLRFSGTRNSKQHIKRASYGLDQTVVTVIDFAHLEAGCVYVSHQHPRCSHLSA